MESAPINTESATPVATPDWVPVVGGKAYVPKLYRSKVGIICHPTQLLIIWIGEHDLGFANGTSQARQFCFPPTPSGGKECLAVSRRWMSHQKAFNWPVME